MNTPSLPAHRSVICRHNKRMPTAACAGFVLRTAPMPKVPRIAVVRLDDFGGEDVAWFHELKDAEEYVEFLHRAHNKVATQKGTVND